MANYDSDPTHVRTVQAAINAAGYQPALVVDGVYGPKTAAGVRWFQGQHGLTQDGIIGDQTMAATITPTPAQVMGGLSAVGQQVASLVQSVASPGGAPAVAATPSPLVAAPLITLPGAAPAAALAQAVVAKPTLASVLAPAAAAAAFPLLPLAGGALAGLAVGSLIKVGLGSILGAIVGAGAGYELGKAAAKPGSKLAALTHFAGETEFGVDFGFDDEDLGDIIAGEIGMPTKVRSLRG